MDPVECCGGDLVSMMQRDAQRCRQRPARDRDDEQLRTLRTSVSEESDFERLEAPGFCRHATMNWSQPTPHYLGRRPDKLDRVDR